MHADLVAHHIGATHLEVVYDVLEGAAAEVAESLGARHARSLDDVLGDDRVEAVCIATSTDTHVDLMMAAAGAGKAILCEKPISLDLAEVDRGLAAVEEAGVPLQVGFNRRFDASHRAVAEAVSGGSIGDLEILRITSRDPEPPPVSYIEVSGGIFLDMTIHDFDMARYVSGSEIVEVSAHGAVRVNPDIADANDLDTAVITLTHANGAFTMIDNSRRAVYGYDQRVEAFGSRGMVASANPLAHTASRSDEEGIHHATLPHFFLDRYVPSYIAEWEAFAEAVRDGTTPPVTGADGRAPLVIGLAAWRSVRERRRVAVEEIT